MNCHDCQSVLPDLLLDQTATSTAAARAHVQSCAACQQEFASLKATIALLDNWEAPEPSAYFDQKLAVRLREEQAMAPEGWFERLRSHLLFNTGRQFRPTLAGTMALVLLIGGGTVVNLSYHEESVEASPTVQDLQILDRNAQALQTMDQLLQEESPVDDGSANVPTSI